ncbi:acyltransferase family protein [Glaciecola sp. SC05]|uniref:acyltransferase family protein n=1 Tax=Glaciecola sp. SC05 TaxID=1987355 RepID=UPI0035289521
MSKFRTDIQGLRAFAVMIVVLFHFNPEFLTGGFIGVDIFFVISGYLMTSIVIRGIESNKFSLVSFYVARVVRIVPALLLLCTTLTIFGFILLNLADASALAKHAVSSVTFISNFVYWSESGYFDDASKYNWLLHTWSLSVEWQFYLVYPIAILLISKFLSIKAIKSVTIVAILCGFLFSLWVSNNMPSASYFLLPTRAWELLIGGAAFFYQLPTTLSQKMRSFLEASGIVLLMLSAFYITESMAWPGYMALFPVLATLLILIANNQSSTLTGNVIAQTIGKWSYSIYLWHWPVVVFLNYFELPKWTNLIGIVVSLIFGWISYRYCEIQFTNRPDKINLYKPKHVLLSFTIVVSIGAGLYVLQDNIFRRNLAVIEPFISGQKYLLNNTFKDAIAGNTYFLNDASASDFDYLAIGDSNLSHYAYGITNRKEDKIILSWEGYCLSFPNYITKPSASYMNKTWESFCENNYKNIDVYQDKPLILAHQWQLRDMICVKEPCIIEPKRSNYYLILENQLDALLEYIGSSRKVFIVGQVPAPSSAVYKCMKGFNADSCPRTSNEKNNERVEVNAMLESFSNKHANVTFINPFSAACNSEFVCTTIIDNKSLFHDEGHLSAFGSIYFWDYISKTIKTKK